MLPATLQSARKWSADWRVDDLAASAKNVMTWDESIVAKEGQACVIQCMYYMDEKQESKIDMACRDKIYFSENLLQDCVLLIHA